MLYYSRDNLENKVTSTRRDPRSTALEPISRGRQARQRLLGRPPAKELREGHAPASSSSGSNL